MFQARPLQCADTWHPLLLRHFLQQVSQQTPFIIVIFNQDFFGDDEEGEGDDFSFFFFFTGQSMLRAFHFITHTLLTNLKIFCWMVLILMRMGIMMMIAGQQPENADYCPDYKTHLFENNANSVDYSDYCDKC